MRNAVLLVALLLAVVSCGQNRSGDVVMAPMTSVPHSAATAAAVVQPLLESEFADAFAGLEVRDDRLLVYRKPDRALDDEVRARAPGVRIDLHDARYSRAEMLAAAARVMDDREHWRDRGADLNVAGPKTDGSGVEVGTAGEPPAQLAAWLQENYPAMSFTVRREGAVVFPVHTGPVPVYPSSPAK